MRPDSAKVYSEPTPHDRAMACLYSLNAWFFQKEMKERQSKKVKHVSTTKRRRTAKRALR